MLDRLKAARAHWTKVRWGEDETTVRDAGDDLNDALSKAIDEIERLREYATHKSGCYENSKECICGLDTLLEGSE